MKSRVVLSRNRSRWAFRAVVIFLLLTMLPLSVAVAEGMVRIVDSKGLIRGYSKVNKSATVIVKLSVEVSSLLSLVNVDGLAGERPSSSSSGAEYRFSGVGPGTWKISQVPAHASVSEVRVTSE